MEESTATHAMTEIALALAMAFFALMILTLVSMGTGQAVQDPVQTPKDTKFSSVDLIAPSTTPQASQQSVAEDDLLIVYYEDQYFLPDLTVLSAEEVKSQAAAAPRVILALSPTVALDQAIAARAVLGGAETVVTPLSAEWMQRLAAP